MFATVQALSGSFNANQAGVWKINVGVKNPHGIAAPANAGHHRIGLLPLVHHGHLFNALCANHTLKVPHHHRIRVRPSHRANDVEGVFYVGDPVPKGLVQCVFEGFAAAVHGNHGRTEEFHAIDVGALAFDIFTAHVDHAFKAIARANGGRCHAMLTGASFCDHTGLAHSFGQHGLTNGVVDLVSSSVVQIFALEVDLSAAHFLAHACGVINGGGASHKVL